MPNFVGRDVALALGYAKPRNAILQHVDNQGCPKTGHPSFTRTYTADYFNKRKKRVITKPNGSTITVSTPMVTPAGQLHILNKFLECYLKI